MENRTDRSDLLSSAKDKLLGEISQEIQQIREVEERINKTDRIIEKKKAEIEKSKKEIKDLAEIETNSKTQIDQNIELLTWLIDNIDNTVNDLRNSMISNSEEAIRESAHDFINFVNDLRDIVEPMGEAAQYSDKDEFKSIIISIAETLKIFSENIEDSIDQMTGKVQKANIHAVDESSQDFDNFVQDIHQIFNTFNNNLQKLQLTNSIRKYLDLEAIFNEISRYSDQIEENRKKMAQIKMDKQSKEEQIQNLTVYGLKKDFSTLKTQRSVVGKRLTEQKEKLDIFQNQHNSLSEKLELIRNEKTTLRDWFQALSDEILESQTRAAETYNIMYGILDNIHSTISFIKSDIRNASEISINAIIRDFTKTVLTFGRMVGIIKKIEQGNDLSQMQKSMGMIYQKSGEYIKNIQDIVENLSTNVKTSNITAIDESFKDFNEFVKNFKEKFYIIQDTVSSITLSTSESLIKDLVGFFEDEIQTRNQLIENLENLLFTELQYNQTQKIIEGLDNELKIFGGKEDRSRRKQLSIMRTVTHSPYPLKQFVSFKMANDGVVSFENVIVSDIIPPGIKIENLSLQPTEYVENDFGTHLKWAIPEIPKREKVENTYTVSGFGYPRIKYLKSGFNISTTESYRFRRLAAPLTLTIIEQNGEGAYILTNTAERDHAWNIYLEFASTSEITPNPNVRIGELKPQESYVKKYHYKKPNCLIPKIFSADTRGTIGLIKKRSPTTEDEYQIELVMINESDFLMCMTHFEVYNLQNLKEPVILVKTHDLEMMRPHLDFRKEFTIKSTEDPPNLVINAGNTLFLTYEYDTSNKVSIKDLQETSGKEISADKKEIEVQQIQEEDTAESFPEIRTIDVEIASTEQQILEYRIKLKALEELLVKKRSDRTNMITKIQAELSERKKKQEEEERLRKEDEKRKREEEQTRAELIKRQAEEEKKMAELKAKMEKEKLEKELAERRAQDERDAKQKAEKELAERKALDAKEAKEKLERDRKARELREQAAKEFAEKKTQEIKKAQDKVAKEKSPKDSVQKTQPIKSTPVQPTKQQPSPKAASQQTTPKGTAQQTTPKGTAQQTSPKAASQQTTPKATAQQTSPKKVPQQPTKVQPVEKKSAPKKQSTLPAQKKK